MINVKMNVLSVFSNIDLINYDAGNFVSGIKVLYYIVYKYVRFMGLDNRTLCYLIWLFFKFKD